MEAPKTIKGLISLGVPEIATGKMIDFFNKGNGAKQEDYPLTNFQASVFADPVTLNSDSNIIIAGPTSSGKTLIAQAIISKTLSEKQNSKVLYLVPLKALVTEKYSQFHSVYQNYRILPASSDYPRCDSKFEKGEWDISVAVFEKVFRWMTKERMLPKIIQEVDLVIIDELQVLEMPERGEKLEALISFFLWLRDKFSKNKIKPRIISLVASEEIARSTKEWLHAEIPGQCIERPVPLYEGWISPKKKYEIFLNTKDKILLPETEFPSRLKNVFDSIDWPHSNNTYQLILNIVKALIINNMRVLIYTASQGDAEQLAIYLSVTLLKDCELSEPSHDLLSLIDELDDSPVGEKLSKTLLGKVGFHHGNMTQAERKIVERGFLQPGEKPQINVVVTTPTLSMGINLPADVVLMRDRHTFGITSASTDVIIGDPRDNRKLLTVLDYQNFAGRAGRYKFDPDKINFGLCLFIINHKNFDQEINEVRQLLHGNVKPIISQLSQPMFDYHPHILAFCSALSQLMNYSSVFENVIKIFQGSYLWVSEPKAQEDLIQKLCQSYKELEYEKLISKTGITGPGKVVAGYHLSVIGARKLLSLSIKLPKLWPKYRLELLCELASLPEIQNEYPRTNNWSKITLYEMDVFKGRLKSYLKQWIPSSFYTEDSCIHKFIYSNETEMKNYSEKELSVIIRAVILWEWLSGRRITILTSNKAFPPGLTLKQIESLAERIGYYMGALRNLWEQTLPEEIAVWDRWEIISKQLWLFEHMVMFGVLPEVLYLPLIVLELSNIRLTRKMCIQLYAEFGGWNDIRELIQMPYPISIRNPHTWDDIQKCLVEWNESYEKFGNAEGDEGNIMFQTFQYLASGVYKKDFSTIEIEDPRESNVDNWKQRAGIDDLSYNNLIENTQKHMERFTINQLNGLRGFVESALARPPLSCIFHPVQDAPAFVRSIQIDQEYIIIALVAGKPTENDFKDIPSHLKGIVVICGEPPDSELQEHYRKKIRLFILAEALYAGSELVEFNPRHLRRFLKILYSKGCIDSGTSLFEAMFPKFLEN